MKKSTFLKHINVKNSLINKWFSRQMNAAMIFVALLFFSQTAFCQNYPDVRGNVVPTPEPTLPGEFDVFSPPVDATVPATGVPIIFDWTKTAGSDESVFFIGHNLGSNAIFKLYTQTDGSNGLVLNSLIDSLNNTQAIIKVPHEALGNSTYAIWAQNATGTSFPVLINKSEAWWLGPDKAVVGQTTAIHGRNLSHEKGTILSWIYIKPESGSGVWVEIVSVNPYKVEFKVPALANGSYEVWVHNGHGAHYGWSKSPNNLIVYNGAEWSTTEYSVKDYGAIGDGSTNDTQAIRDAINAAKANPKSTVYFPAGTYRVTDTLKMASDMRWRGDGKLKTTIKGYDPIRFLVVARELNTIEIKDICLEMTGVINEATYSWDLESGIFDGWGSKNVWLTNVKLNGDKFLSPFCTPWGKKDGTDPDFGKHMPFGFSSCEYVYISNCDIIGDCIFTSIGKQYFFDRCNIYGCSFYDGSESAFDNWSVKEFSITNCFATDQNKNGTYQDILKRFYITNGAWGTDHEVYIGGNKIEHCGTHEYSVDKNKGEMFLWETAFSETMTIASIDDLTHITFNESLGYLSPPNNGIREKECLMIKSGLGQGQIRRIVNYEGKTCTIDRPWDLVPNGTSKIVHVNINEKIAVYDNYEEGSDYLYTTHDYSANCAISFYSVNTNTVYSNNKISKTVGGITFAVMSVADGDPTQCMFDVSNLIENNEFNHIKADGLSIWTQKNTPELQFIGNVFRNNKWNMVNGSVSPESNNNMNIYEGDSKTNTAFVFAPGNLLATTISPSQIRLTWIDNADNETGYKIERKTGLGGTYDVIEYVDAGVNIYSDKSLMNATQYYYRVTAFNEAKESEKSNEAVALTGVATNVPVSDIINNPVLDSIFVSKTLQINTVIIPYNATNDTITWTSSDDLIATVSATGLITGVSDGMVNITASVDSKTALSAIKIKPYVALTEITLNETEVDLSVNNTYQLTNTIVPENASIKTIIWSSDNSLVATVDAQGFVTGISEGSATITAKTEDGGLTASCTFTVSIKHVMEIVIDPASVSIPQNNGISLTAIITPNDATDKSITWRSANTSIAIVDDNGQVYGKAVGTTTITVTAIDGGITATCPIIVTENNQTHTVVIALNAGGSIVGNFQADDYFSQSSENFVYTDQNTIDVSVPNAAPAAVYQSERHAYTRVEYNIPDLTANTNYIVRLHFAEIYFDEAGIRVMNVKINGNQVLTSFDVWSEAGNKKNKALVKDFTATADANGIINIQFISVKEHPKVSGIEILTTSNTGVTTVHSSSIKVYPNPAHDKVTVSFANENEDLMDIKLVNLTGHVLFQKQTKENKFAIDCSVFPQGVYILKVCSRENIMAVEKIIVE